MSSVSGPVAPTPTVPTPGLTTTTTGFGTPVDTTPASTAPAPILANRFAGLGSAAALGLVSPSVGLGDFEALFAQVAAKLKETERELTSLRAKQSTGLLDDLIKEAVDVGGVKLLAAEVSGVKDMRDFMDKAKGKMKSGVLVFGQKNGPKVQLVAGVTADLVGQYNAGNIVREMAIICGGKGGGKPDMAMAGGTEPEKLKAALDSVAGLLQG